MQPLRRSPRDLTNVKNTMSTCPRPRRCRTPELMQFQVRVIALENLMIMLLAEGSDRQLELAREMAAYISPRLASHPIR
jgi:hypothetical protein